MSGSGGTQNFLFFLVNYHILEFKDKLVAPDITCGNHSESSRAFRKVTSESVGMVLGTQALISFLKLAFTCRIS